MLKQLIVATLLVCMAAPVAAQEATSQEEVKLVPPLPRQGYYVGGGFRPAITFIETSKDGQLGPLPMSGLEFR